MSQTTIDDFIIKTIVDAVKNGKNKIDVANELGCTYYFVKKHTKDIHTPLRISHELEQQIRNEVKNGSSIRQTAEKLNVCRWTVIKYTRDIEKKPIIRRKYFSELIEEIRVNVRKYNSKTLVAKEMKLTYNMVRWCTRDIPIIKKTLISPERKEFIRNEVKKGKMKTQLAEDMNLPYHAILRITSDIHSCKKKADISHRALLLLQEIMSKGYAFPNNRHGLKEYLILKKKFPNLYRVEMERKSIFFFEDKSDVAARAFLASFDQRITNYHQLKRVIKAFKVNMNPDEKRNYIHRKKLKMQRFDNNFKVTRLRENDDSFVEIKLFHLFFEA